MPDCVIPYAAYESFATLRYSYLLQNAAYFSNAEAVVQYYRNKKVGLRVLTKLQGIDSF
jgi:hypothetical protein